MFSVFTVRGPSRRTRSPPCAPCSSPRPRPPRSRRQSREPRRHRVRAPALRGRQTRARPPSSSPGTGWWSAGGQSVSGNLRGDRRAEPEVGRAMCDLLRVPAGEGEVLQRGADGALLLGTL